MMGKNFAWAPNERVQAVLDATLNPRPGNATHRNVRSLSEEFGVRGTSSTASGERLA